MKKCIIKVSTFSNERVRKNTNYKIKMNNLKYQSNRLQCIYTDLTAQGKASLLQTGCIHERTNILKTSNFHSQIPL